MVNYEKRYKEALEKAKSCYSITTPVADIELIELIFPELKESEDERVRKELLDFCKNRAEKYPNDPKYKNISAWIAWLEKQGKNNMGISESTKQELEGNLNKALEKETPESLSEFIDEQGEQKPADKVEPKFKVGDEIKTANEESLAITKIDEKGYWSEDLFICGFDDAAKWELVEQKPAWSEEDETKIKSIIAFLKSPSLCAMDGNKGMIDENIKYLNSLKYRYTWKPSEGQLECLGYAIEKAEKDWSPLTNNRIYLTLKALKEQLLELRVSKV